MSYQIKNEYISDSFRTAYEALMPGGIFIFDVWYGPGVLTDRPATRKKIAEDEMYQVIKYAEPIMHYNNNYVDVCYDILMIDKNTEKARRIKEVHSMRYFFKPEIVEFLESTGFKLLKCLDCSTLEEPDFFHGQYILLL